MPTGAIIGGAVSGLGSMVGGMSQSSAYGKAAQESTDAQMAMYNQSRTDQLPLFRGEEEAFAQYLYGMGEQVPSSLQKVLPKGWSPTGAKGQYMQPYNAEQMYSDPGYQFRLQQGNNSLMAQGAGTGMYGSGNLGVALSNYNQQAASQEYSGSYGRYQDTVNRLAGLAGQATTTSQALGQQSLQTGTNIGNTLMQGGTNQASAMMNMYNQMGSMGGNMMNYGMLSNMMQGQGGGSSMSGFNPSGTDYTSGFNSGLYYY